MWRGRLANGTDLRFSKRVLFLCAGLWLLEVRTPYEVRAAAAQDETATAGSHSAQNPPDNQSAQEPTSSSKEHKTDEKPIETDKDKEEKKTSRRDSGRGDWELARICF
jgi:hypothetical protein